MNKIYQWIDQVWQWVSETIFVRFEFDLPIDSLKEKLANGKLVFAIANGGLIEWLIVSSWCRSQGLGAILVANRKRILFLSKPLYFLQIAFRRRRYKDLFLSQQEGPRLFISPSHERKKIFDPTPGEKILAEIYSGALKSGTLGQIYFVPIFIRWRKHVRGGARNPSEYLFGLSSSPNLFGKLWYLFRARRDSTVSALDPFTLSGKEVEGVDGIEESEAAKVARAARRKILVLTNQEMRVVLGPRYLSPHSVKETLMRDPEIQKIALEVAAEEGIDKKKVMMRTYQYLTEIVANYTFRFVEVMYVLLTWLFTRVFEGVVVQEKDLQEVREIMKHKPIVFVSCHRSHLDYLVVPYVLFIEDMITPHIAAGVNLSFWPVGPFLRMGGAFFIRRSFRGNPLYSACLSKYIEYLVKNRYNVKFFIEGTRSRSGKLLPPAYGLLKTVLQAQRNHAVDDIALIPVSICYDEVWEEGSYSKELGGVAKQKETAKELLKSRHIIKKNFGKVYVRFGEAMYAKEIYKNVDEQGIDPTLTLQKTAFQLCKSINDVSPVTPKSLVCTLLLTHSVGSLPLEELLRLSEQLAQYVIASGVPLSVPLEDGFRRAIEQTVRRLQRSGMIAIAETVPRKYFADEKKRLSLNFYKNNAIHCFVTPAICTMAFFRAAKNWTGTTPGESFYDAFVANALALRNLLKFEFFFSPTPVFINELRKTFSFFAGERDWVREPKEAWLRGLQGYFREWSDISIYLTLLGELLESYSLAAEMLKENAGGTFEKKAFLQKMLRFAENKKTELGVIFPESLSTQNFSNALLMFENIGFVSVQKNEDKTALSLGVWNLEAQAIARDLSSFLDLMKDSAKVV